MTDEQRADDDHDVLVVVAKQVQEIHAIINGNGQPGIRQRTESLERWRSYITGALAVILIVVGWLANAISAKAH